MVAEASKVTSKREKRLTPKIPLATRTKARNLYVLHQLGAPEVARQTGLTESQIYSLSFREGWTKVRSQIRQDSLEKSNARMGNDADEMVEAAAMESGELVLSTFTKAKEAIAKGGPMAAKDVQAWSQATKNYVGIYRQARSLDVQAGDGQGATVNVMFVGQLPKSSERVAPRNVTPSEASVVPTSAPHAQESASAQPAIDVASTQGSQG